MASTRNIVLWIVIASVAALFVIMIGVSIWSLTHNYTGMPLVSVGDKVALIEVEGIIESSEDIVRQLKKYSDDSSIPVIVLRINSPGGAVAPSQEIYDQIVKVRNDGTYVVVSISSLAASGGYYIACAADTIIANPGSLTGSIGVIFSFYTFEGLMDKVGMQLEVVKSGALKDVGNMSREMTQKEQEMLQTAIDDVYNQFVLAVSQSRNLDIEQVEDIADGSIFTGNQALELGLVDKLGGLEDAIVLAGEMAGLGDDPKVVKEYQRRPGLMDYLAQKAAVLLDISISKETWPKLEYIYK
ncbi:MAG: signal peptide peptidase SppA [candidate division Zixibacteria bacterium]|nr:signal peptide peptidase SppA [candidate division Zixibacteria bacterium]